MEISNQEGEMPIPLNSTYIGGGGGVHGHGPHGHLIHHHHDPPPLNHIIPSTTPPQVPSNGISMPNNSLEIEQASSSSYKKLIKYKECLKNHAASMGGNATDGCGEFMPSGEEGSIEALTCSACNCHRNFHRKEIEGEQPCSFDTWPHLNRTMQGRKLILGHHHKNILTGTTTEALGYPTATSSFIPSRSAPHPHHMIMSYNMGSQLPSESDEQEDGSGGGVGPNRPPQLMKKRFRTKFTQEQKEKMFNFAEKVGWKIQKQEDSVVQQFCQEIGVKRRVLKVWMHNNKHNLAKKNALLSA